MQNKPWFPIDWESKDVKPALTGSHVYCRSNGDDEAVYVVPVGVQAKGGEGCGLQAAHKSQWGLVGDEQCCQEVCGQSGRQGEWGVLAIMAKGEVQEDLGDEMEKGGIGNARGSAQTLTWLW